MMQMKKNEQIRLYKCSLISNPHCLFGLTQILSTCKKCGEPWKLLVRTESLEKYLEGENFDSLFQDMIKEDKIMLKNECCRSCIKRNKNEEACT